MAWRVSITADFDTEAEALKAEADIEEAVGKSNGDLQYTELYDTDDT